jgi:hypothetical protein
MIKRLRAFALALILLLLLANNSFAAITERYVDFANGEDGTGGHDGTTEALAWKTLQYALDTATAAAGGTRINVEYDGATYTQTIAATIDVDINAAAVDDPIIVQGYSVTVGDGVKAVIDGNSAAVSCLSVALQNHIFKDLQLKGSTGDAVEGTGTGDGAFFYNIEVLTAGGNGIDINTNNAGNKIIGCEINNVGTGGASTGILIGASGANNTVVSYNYIHDITGSGIQIGSACSVFKNIVDTVSVTGIIPLDGSSLFENTVYNSTGDNVNVSSASETVTIMNNIFDTAGDYCVEIVAGGNAWIYGYNNLEHETTGTKTGTIILDVGGAQENVDPQFTDAPNKDFNIGANLDDDGFPATWPGAANTTGNQEIGAVPYEETAGGTGGGASFFTMN